MRENFIVRLIVLRLKLLGIKLYSRLGLRGKTLWDWLQLLFIPLVLAGAAFLFDQAQQERIVAAEATQISQQRSIEATRITEQQQIEDEKAKEQNLQAYLDKMTDLLLHEDLSKQCADWELIEQGGDFVKVNPVCNVAQTRTTTTLRALDRDRRSIVIQFLRGVGLTDTLLVGAHMAGIDLSHSDVSFVNLSKSNLHTANLFKANLHWANLREAWLVNANLREANLTSANLSNANLSSANLELANLRGASLNNADLRGAKLVGATVTPDQLAQALLDENTILPDGKRYSPPTGTP